MRGRQLHEDHGEPAVVAEEAAAIPEPAEVEPAPGPIPPVGARPAGRHAPDPTASDQAYGTAVPRTTPTKRGKDPRYKTKAWAITRLFEQLSDDQKQMLDDYALGEADRHAVPRESTPGDPAPVPAGEPDTTTPDIERQRRNEAAVAAAPVTDAPETGDGGVTEDAGPTPSAGAVLWDGLDAAHRAGFLNITAAMRGNHFNLGGLKLLHDGIHQDRLFFTASSGAQIKADLDRAIRGRKSLGDRGFKSDKPLNGEHAGMADWGGRQCVTTCSMQVGGGGRGVFVDIDEFNPKSNIVGFFGHMFEFLGDKITGNPTDPFHIAQELDERGDDP